MSGDEFRVVETITIALSGAVELIDRHGNDLKAGGLFIQRDLSPAVGDLVRVVFVSDDGTVLLKATGRVVHARPASVPGDKTAGMGLELFDFDERGQLLINQIKGHDREASPVEERGAPTLERLAEPAKSAVSGPVVGIDLGTTNSCIAIVENGEPRILASSKGYETVPSVIYLQPDQKIVAGHEALAKMIFEPERCVYGSKRFIGRRYASREVSTYGHFFHYALTSTKGGLVAAKVENRVIPLELVAAHVLAHLRAAARYQLGYDIHRAVITVPAYFGEMQRNAVREAGRLAGFEVERVLNEPTAAAVAYGYGRKLDSRVIVYDFGGGTFDASAVHVTGDAMEVLATDGDPFLGGSDLDDRLTEFVLMTAERTQNIRLRNDPVAVQRLRFAAEEAKRQLSDVENAMVQVAYLTTAKGASPVNIAVPVSRDLFEGLTEDLVTRTLNIVQSVLDKAGLRTADLDDVVMVGGQSRSPAIRRMLGQRFAMQPSRNTHPDHAIALGAALVGAAVNTEVSVVLRDILSKSIRMALPDGRTDLLLSQGESLPAEKSFAVSTITQGDTEFRVPLYRGEAESVGGNELLGELRVPSNLALAVARTKAPVTLRVGADGVLSAVIQHPMTGATEVLELALPEGSGAVFDMEDLDVVEPGPAKR